MSRWRLLLPILLIAIVRRPFGFGFPQLPPRSTVPVTGCGTVPDGNVSSPVPAYQANRRSLVNNLRAGAVANGGFLNGSAGAPPDEAFGAAMCFADHSMADCQECLDMVSNSSLRECPNSRRASLIEDACVLRLAEEPSLPVVYTGGSDGNRILLTEASETYLAHRHAVSMNRTRWKLMTQLAVAASTSLRRQAYGSLQAHKGSDVVYGLVQCWRPLAPDKCAYCLRLMVEELTTGFPNNTAVSLKAFSCYVRYQLQPITILESPELKLPKASPSPALMPPEESPPPAGVARLTPSKGTKKRLIAGLIVVIGSVFILIGLSILGLLLWRQHKKRSTVVAREECVSDSTLEKEFKKGTGPKRFGYNELAAATEMFSDRQKLGEGGFGSVYRGFLKELNLHVAVKRVSRSSKQGRKEYASEVMIISRLRHRNLVQLIGWSHAGDELMLVYELMPNGSLDTHLYSAGDVLSWPLRHDIVLGIGSALLYLHQEWEQCVVHRDIKPSNVMLDASFNAKLGDFGLARLVDHGRGSHTTELAGTTGYMDPECTVTGRFSTESDVYSFGVLLLEVACGRQPVVVLQDGGVVHLAQRVSEMYERGGRGMILHAADPRLDGAFDAREMESVLVTGLWCTNHDRTMRPSIRQVVSVLRFEAPMPSLPQRMPVSTYKLPPVGLLNSTSSSSLELTSISQKSTSFRPLGNGRSSQSHLELR